VAAIIGRRYLLLYDRVSSFSQLEGDFCASRDVAGSGLFFGPLLGRPAGGLIVGDRSYFTLMRLHSDTALFCFGSGVSGDSCSYLELSRFLFLSPLIFEPFRDVSRAVPLTGLRLCGFERCSCFFPRFFFLAELLA